ncbi:MAG: hypothetical protein ACREDT_09430 [Methylocella sp.]
MIVLNIGADRSFEFGQILEAKTFRESIADFDLGWGRGDDTAGRTES